MCAIQKSLLDSSLHFCPRFCTHAECSAAASLSLSLLLSVWYIKHLGQKAARAHDTAVDPWRLTELLDLGDLFVREAVEVRVGARR